MRSLLTVLCLLFLFPSEGSAKTVEDRIKEFGKAVEERMKPYFEKAGVHYPPQRMTLIGLKEEKILEIYASDGAGRPERWIRSYRILAASGHLGPKLRQGDSQIPEGIYRIDVLNPNSLYHLSMRINYPNADDKARAREEGRTNLGGDIMIHGHAVSIGCIAVGDEASEDLFVMAALAKLGNVRVILSPLDLRVKRLEASPNPLWTQELYLRIQKELGNYSRPSP